MEINEAQEIQVEKEIKSGHKRSAKSMLWISMISMTMMFAGLTSAYYISMSREDWVSFTLPVAFTVSTILIVLSSLSMMVSVNAMKSGKQSLSLITLGLTFLLGLGFIWSQLEGYAKLIELGFYFTGTESSVSSSFLYVISVIHLLHVIAGVLVLAFMLIKMLRGGYSKDDFLGLELGAIFWHFVDVLWIYLFFFFYLLS